MAWITQDYDGYLKLHNDMPSIFSDIWISDASKLNGRYSINRNWEDSLINLETHDYKIEDGILIKVEKVNTKRHKHADLMIAWAEDKTKEVQFYDDEYKKWVDCGNSVTWYEDMAYRIKPKIKTVRFRNYLTTDGDVRIQQDERQNLVNFKEWIGDWKEVEVDTND